MKPIFFLCMVFCLAVLCGCETVKGVGRDITGASSSVQDAMSGRR